jgi:hypothetical protein
MSLRLSCAAAVTTLPPVIAMAQTSDYSGMSAGCPCFSAIIVIAA